MIEVQEPCKRKHSMNEYLGLVILGITSIMDIRTRIIPHKFTVPLIFLGTILFPQNIIAGFIGYILSYFGYAKNYWGGGDVTTFAIVGLYFGMFNLTLITLYFLLGYNLYLKLMNKLAIKEVPLVPWIMFCCILTFI